MNERGAISSALTITILIVITAVGLIVGHFVMTTNKVDYASKSTVQSAANDFVNEVTKKGTLYATDLDNFVEKINQPYARDVEVQITEPGENPGKKPVLDVSSKQGEGQSTTYFDSQIKDALDTKGYYKIPNGGQITVSVYQASDTMSDQLTSSDKYGDLIAEATATCTTD